MRRIQRRMHVLQIEAVPAYIEQLRTLPNEARAAVPRAADQRHAASSAIPRRSRRWRRKVIPGCWRTSAVAGPIRVWVPGCATGEEAYSIAILLREGLARSESRRPVQIFATDIDDRAIEAARAGLYPGAIAAGPLRRAAGAELRRGERQLPRRQGHPRDVPVLDARSGQGPAVLEARSGLLPQSADLLRAAIAAAGRSPPSTTPCGRAGICSWDPRRASPRSRICSRRSTSGTGSMCGGTRRRAFPPSRSRASPERSRAPAAGRAPRRMTASTGVPPAPSRRTHRRSWSWTGSTASCVSPGTRPNISSRRRGSRVWTCSPCCTWICGPRARTALKQAAATGAPVRHDDHQHQDGRAVRGRQPDRRSRFPIRKASGLSWSRSRRSDGCSGRAAGGRVRRARQGRRHAVEALNSELRGAPGAASHRHRGAGGRQRGTAILQRGIPVGQRGAAIGERGAGDLEGGAAIAQRGAADDQRGAEQPEREPGCAPTAILRICSTAPRSRPCSWTTICASGASPRVSWRYSRSAKATRGGRSATSSAA